MQTKLGKVLVVFGSQSDEPIYSKLTGELKGDWDVDGQVISAHRDPLKLKKHLEDNRYHFIVAGAGLAAHLPGVIASLVTTPVIGVPVASQLGGVDALASIVQMPYGVPVLAVGPHMEKNIPTLLKAWHAYGNGNKMVEVICPDHILPYEYTTKELTRLKDCAHSLKWEVSITNVPMGSGPRITLVENETQFDSHPLAVNVPIWPKQEFSNPANLLKILTLTTQGGLWTGINNSRNALVAINKIITSLGE